MSSENPIISPLVTEWQASQNREATAELITKLFVYGSLNDEKNFQMLTGRVLRSETAILWDYRKINPKHGFPFAMSWKGSKIEGRLVHDIDSKILSKLDEYEGEGELYTRKVVTVKTADQDAAAYVYIGNPEALEPYFRKGVAERDRIEMFVEKNVNRYLESKASHFPKLDRENLAIKVTRELLSEEIHNILRHYFYDVGLPPFIIKHEIEKANIPRLSWLREDFEACHYADAYLNLATRFMIFNQLEEKFRNDYRGHVKVADEFYLHTISATMALKMMVNSRHQILTAMMELGVDRFQRDLKYTDYAVGAIFIAEELYQREDADNIASWVQLNRHVGDLPLGAELEFSNIGGDAIGAGPGDDPIYDCFFYFYDFDLMRRGWKLGAHIDDHGFLTSSDVRTRGFLELAFGRYKLLGDVSKPATQDPWILSQIIDLAVRFLDVKPHSLHISIEAPAEKPFRHLENPEYFLCLLLLGGDLREDQHGKLREMRIYRGEILHHDVGVNLSRLNRHHQSPDDRAWKPVVEYQFPRLNYEYDYQPLIMALKGFQIGANPHPFKGIKDNPDQELYDELETALIQWAAYPTTISSQAMQKFIGIVEKGLEEESEKLDKGYAKYAQRIVGRIEDQLQRRNNRIANYHAEVKRKIVGNTTTPS